LLIDNVTSLRLWRQPRYWLVQLYYYYYYYVVVFVVGILVDFSNENAGLLIASALTSTYYALYILLRSISTFSSVSPKVDCTLKDVKWYGG
jgi:hypothetical protein